LYYFAKFAIVNELLIIEDRHISARGRIGLPQLDTVPSARAAAAKDVRNCLQAAMVRIA